ncbi:MAG: hypothetical protein EA373_00325 [Oceanospirillales bacterium]|nr:MAG: hypothetical protein EA373_00325 [Oceanospirillales bacterium]
MRGFLGGLIGGIIGEITFIILVFLFGNLIGRMAGVAAIGFFIGLTIIIIESAFRDVWLVVHYSHNERKTITIGSQPVLLGSSNKANIYLPNSKGFTSVTARVFVENKMIFIKFDEEYTQKIERIHGQKMGNLTQQLKDGDKRKLGDILFEVKTR